jgi:hypothetical protein
MESMNTRYAVSLYADLRTGTKNGVVYSKEQAFEVVENTYGKEAASYAQEAVG